MSNNKHYLPEIDGLRAVAVIAVIGNHFFEEILPSGFLGVDIFFVISGFVISAYLTRTTPENWTGYLGDFYAKRIKRLFPALFFCIFLTSILLTLVTTRPSADILNAGSWALFGLSNNYLFALSSNYFSLDAKLNPFTHTWSLGVEEQFYLLFPWVFALLGYVGSLAGKTKINGLYVLIFLTMLSLSGYIVSYHISENAAFYLIHNRFWELSLGSLTYLVWEKKNHSRLNIYISLLVLVFLAALLFVPNQFQFITTIICVILTASLLLSMRKGDFARQFLSIRVLVFIGQISYSLYLWHWSILVLGKWTIGESLYAKFFLLVLAFLLAIFSYYFIERKWRYKTWAKNNLRTMMYAFIAALVLIAFNNYIFTRFQSDNNNIASRLFNVPEVPDWSTSLECHGREKIKPFPRPLDHCLGVKRSNGKPSVIYLIGDSHAAQFVFMLEKVIAGSPYALRFINTEDESDFPVGVINNENSRSNTLDYVVENAKAGDYVMIAFHRGHLNDLRDKHLPLDQEIEINQITKNFIHNTSPYFEQFREKDVNVILVRDTPLMQVVSTSSSCLFQIRLFGESICRISKAQDIHTRYRQDFAFDKLQDEFGNVVIWNPSEALYNGKNLFDVVDDKGNYIMMDWHHISRFQSELLAGSFQDFFFSQNKKHGE